MFELLYLTPEQYRQICCFLHFSHQCSKKCNEVNEDEEYSEYQTTKFIPAYNYYGSNVRTFDLASWIRNALSETLNETSGMISPRSFF